MYQHRGIDMCRSQAHLLLACFAILLMPASVLASLPILDTCAECHGTDGMGQGIPMVPVIAAIPAEHIEDAIFAYQDGARRCANIPRMCETVATLSDSEVTELADYYAGKARVSSDQEFDKKLATEGALVHQTLCATCHLSPDSEDLANAVGIPLHGQRLDYLRYAIKAYLGGDREVQFKAMADALGELRPGDIDALVNYYSSYRPVP